MQKRLALCAIRKNVLDFGRRFHVRGKTRTAATDNAGISYFFAKGHRN
jgi:hypothetical protein